MSSYRPMLLLASTLTMGLTTIMPALAAEGTALPPQEDRSADAIWQFFVPSRMPKAQGNSGAYLWVPPAAPRIRAVMIGIHNGLPLPILQHPAIRAVCRTHGIAQILMTPNGSEIGPVMLKDLNFDITDDEKTAVYDRYLQDLATVSGHPELVAAPIVPLAHSAYMSFPFDAAMRRPGQCLGALPIKAGMPDVYAFYGTGGKAKTPNPALNLGGVPILMISSTSQETVAGDWKTKAYPYPQTTPLTYRQDRKDNPGTTPVPRNEMFGASLEMLSGHFDMAERNYRTVAAWLDAVATARLPTGPGAALKPLALKDGWLFDPRVPANGQVGAPGRYLDFGGDRAKALWYPTEALAQEQCTQIRDISRGSIEVFSALDPGGTPIELTEGPMAVMPEPMTLLGADGTFTITSHHFTAPPRICTATGKDHGKNPTDQHTLGNPLFPGAQTLPVSSLPLEIDASGSAVEVVGRRLVTDSRGVAETRFNLRLARNRFSPGTVQLLFLRMKHGGNATFLPTGRTVQISWWYGGIKGGKDQKLDFPEIADAPATTATIPLKATSSLGLPVDYFVPKGPGIIRDRSFIPMEVPAGTGPIEVTVGAYQNGSYAAGAVVKPSEATYRTFRLTR